MNVRRAWQQLQGDCPHAELCWLAKELMRSPVKDARAGVIGELVPFLAALVRDPAFGRPAFQALRCFVRLYGCGLQLVVETTATASAVDLLLAGKLKPRFYQTTLSFVASLRDTVEVTDDLFVAIVEFMHLMRWSVTRVNRTLLEVGWIVGFAVQRRARLERSPLFTRIIELMMADDTPWVLFVQASWFIARMVMCGDRTLFEIAVADGRVFRALRALLEVDHIQSTRIALDMMMALIRAGMHNAVIAEKWIRERIGEIASDSGDPTIVGRAKVILGIMSQPPFT